MESVYAVKAGSSPISWRQSRTVNGGEYLWKKEYGDIDKASVWDAGLMRHREPTAEESAVQATADEARKDDERREKAARQVILDTVEDNLKRISGMEVDELFAVTRILIRQVALLAGR